MDRRSVLKLGLAGAVAGVLPARAQAKEIYFVTYPGSLDDAFKTVVGPAFRQRTGATPVFSPMLNTDLIGKVKAAQANPPYDVAIFDDGPHITAIRDGLIEKIPVDEYPVVQELAPALRNPSGYGPVMAMTGIGIAYNPKRISQPPTEWSDLFKPEFKGRVGILGPASTLGTTFLVELSKLNGGSETNVEPGFKAIKELLPQVGGIAANPGALMTLLSQGQVDIAPNFTNNVLSLRARGGDIAFAIPKSGMPLQTITLAIIKNARNRELAKPLIETILNAEVQSKLEAEPFTNIPSNAKVKFTGQNTGLASSVDELISKGKFLNWASFVDMRAGWTDRFNREIRT